MVFVESAKAKVRKAATSCVLALVVKNSDRLANAVVEMCHDPGSTEQRAVRMQILGRCGEPVPDLSPQLEAEKQRYSDLVAAAPAKRERILEIKRKQAQIKRMRQEQVSSRWARRW
jgi:lipase chaperone LimK